MARGDVTKTRLPAQVKKANRDLRIKRETGGCCCRCKARATCIVAHRSHFELLCKVCNGVRGSEIRMMNKHARALQVLLFPEGDK